MIYTVISTNPDEFPQTAARNGQQVSYQHMNKEALVQWYGDNWGIEASHNRLIVDTIIDSLAGEYEILAGLTDDEYTDMPANLTPDEAAEELFDLIQTGTPNIRDYNAANNNIIPPADWLERVADLFTQTSGPKLLPFHNELKNYLDSAATALAAESKHGAPIPVAIRTRLQIDTFLLQSAVAESTDVGDAIDLLQTIKANFQPLTDDMAPQTYDYQPRGSTPKDKKVSASDVINRRTYYIL